MALQDYSPEYQRRYNVLNQLQVPMENVITRGLDWLGSPTKSTGYSPAYQQRFNTPSEATPRTNISGVPKTEPIYNRSIFPQEQPVKQTPLSDITDMPAHIPMTSDTFRQPRAVRQLNQPRSVRQATTPRATSKLTNINQPVVPENIQGSQRTLLEQQQDLANYYRRYPKTISQINSKTGERVIVEDPTALTQALRNVGTLGGADIGAQASMYGADTGLERQRLANIGSETTARIGAERGRYRTTYDPNTLTTTTTDTTTGTTYQNGIEIPRITFDEASQEIINTAPEQQAQRLQEILTMFPDNASKQAFRQRYFKLRGQQ